MKKYFLNYLQNNLCVLKKTFVETFLNRRSFAFWGLVIILLNFVMLHGLGFASDLEFWRRWIRALEMGFGNFTGDYPPLYIFWLRVVAYFYHVTGFSMDLDYELKQFCMFPVILAHLSLAHFVWLRLQNRKWDDHLKAVAMLLVVANPMIYLDGPVWGQVDILPATICVWALWYASKPKTYAIGIGLFVLGLATKFQMIMFLPVFGALALRYRKIMWKGLFAVGIVFVAAFLPFILAGNFANEFSQAYLHTVGEYPYAAMNAGNLWMFISGNMTPDTRPIFEWAPTFLNPNLLGKILFVIVSFVVLVYCFVKRLSQDRIMMIAAMNALAFFMLLPCMHERYALAAAVMCIAAISCQRKPNFGAGVLISGIAFLNIAMMMSIRGDALWHWISAFGILALVYFFVLNVMPETLKRAQNFLGKIPVPGFIPYIILLVIYAFDVAGSFAQIKESAYVLKDGEMFVYDLDLIHQQQGYGTTRIGKSIDGNPLHIGGNLYVAGLGTHSPSRHVYQLPANASRFTVSCGVDDESGNGVVEFIILLDGRELWRSGRMDGRRVASADLDIRGGHELSLVTDEMGSKNFDHADWVNPVVYIEK